MLTFLPFPRAVKAPARSIGVYALITTLCLTCASCAARGTARQTEGPTTGPLPDTARAESAVGLEPAANDAGASVPQSNQATALDSSIPPPEVSLELPYPVDARPRSESPMQAAAEDEELARWNVGGSSDPSAASSQATFHPGTRVVVDTRPAKLRPGAVRRTPPRGLTFERVQAQARSHGYWPFRLCFEAGQREKKGAGGETRVAFSIGTRGKVRAARLLDSKLENRASAACLVREVLKLEFTPRPPRVVPLVASIRIWPGDAELPSASEPAVAVLPPGGSFDPGVMRARVAEKQTELNGCFADARRTDPGLWGRLALTVILEVDGSVHRVSEVESRFPSATATRCAQMLISGLGFPSVNGKPFSFVLPLRLNPTLDATQPSSDQDPNSADSAADAGVD